MRGALYVWDGKVFRQDFTSIEIGKFKVNFCGLRSHWCSSITFDLGANESGPSTDQGYVRPSSPRVDRQVIFCLLGFD
jgi:hypothetical protein